MSGCKPAGLFYDSIKGVCLPFAPIPPSPCDDFMKRKDLFVREDPKSRAMLAEIKKMPAGQRIECISRFYLGLPYLRDAQGEGIGIDPGPLHNDCNQGNPVACGFDCITAVEEWLAIMDSPGEHFDTLQRIRYKNGKREFWDRNHFPELDWIPNLLSKGFIRDITRNIAGSEMKTASLKMNRRKWMLKRNDLSTVQKRAVAHAFRKNSLRDKETASVDYIPLEAFFTESSSGATLNPGLVEKLPYVSLLFTIRDERTAKSVGVLGAHVALLFHPPGQEPFVRQASLLDGIVRDEPLSSYIEAQVLRAGIALYELRDQTIRRASLLPP